METILSCKLTFDSSRELTGCCVGTSGWRESRSLRCVVRLETRVDDSRLSFQVGITGVADVVCGHHVVEFGREHGFCWQHWSGRGLVLTDDGCHVVFAVSLIRVESVCIVELLRTKTYL